MKPENPSERLEYARGVVIRPTALELPCSLQEMKDFAAGKGPSSLNLFREGTAIRLRCVLRDLWVGVYIEEPQLKEGMSGKFFGRWVEQRTYVCLFPCLPIVITKAYDWKELWEMPGR